MRDFPTLLQRAAERHGHLCSGQVLGVRLCLCGLKELGIDPDQEPKRLIVYVEIDRCAADAIATVTGCSLGKRTLKFVDYGKMAATFVDTRTGRAVRVVVPDSTRERARGYAPAGSSNGRVQLAAYQVMPDAELFRVQPVSVVISDLDMPGRPLRRVECAQCGEGINDGREVIRDGHVLCRACSEGSYYTTNERSAFASSSTLVTAGTQHRSTVSAETP
jgi:formylmethanofuran dehydrogenase subunit E